MKVDRSMPGNVNVEVPEIVDTFQSSALSSDIADRNFAGGYFPTGLNPGALFLVSIYMMTQFNDGTAGTVNLNLQWIDPLAGARTYTANINLASATSFWQSVVPCWVGGFTPPIPRIHWNTTHTGAYNTASYALMLAVERLFPSQT